MTKDAAPLVAHLQVDERERVLSVVLSAAGGMASLRHERLPKVRSFECTCRRCSKHGRGDRELGCGMGSEADTMGDDAATDATTWA